MIQFNLLPDIKQEYIKAAKLKRLVISLSGLVIIAVLVILAIVTSLYVARSNHLSNLDTNITDLRSDLEETNDISKILTVQNQLNSLPALHEKKPEATRLFTYLSQITPQDVTFNDLTVNFIDHTIVFKGSSPQIANANTLADTLKFTNFSILTYEDDPYGSPAMLFNQTSSEGPTRTNEDNQEVKSTIFTGNAFSEVVLAEFSIDDDKVNYEIIARYDPLLFDGVRDVRLVVPDRVTTRSAIERPQPLFVADPEEEQE